jgi:hypothetical protein
MDLSLLLLLALAAMWTVVAVAFAFRLARKSATTRGAEREQSR